MRNGAKPILDKQLGQHFLTNRGVLDKIVARIESLSPKREVIEVGPGGGALTGALLASGLRVVAVELDERWVAFLRETYSSPIASGQLTIVAGDATQISHDQLRNQFAGGVTLCGNLPYNCGQEIVLRFFEEADYVTAFAVMLQKEVSDKFTGKPDRKSYGPLAIKLSFLTVDLQTFPVSAGSFTPPPKVESALLSFRRAPTSALDPLTAAESYRDFSLFLKRAFHQRRKKLSNNLGKSVKFPEDFLAWGHKRAEELSPAQLRELWLALRKG